MEDMEVSADISEVALIHNLNMLIKYPQSAEYYHLIEDNAKGVIGKIMRPRDLENELTACLNARKFDDTITKLLTIDVMEDIKSTIKAEEEIYSTPLVEYIAKSTDRLRVEDAKIVMNNVVRDINKYLSILSENTLDYEQVEKAIADFKNAIGASTMVSLYYTCNTLLSKCKPQVKKEDSEVVKAIQHLEKTITDKLLWRIDELTRITRHLEMASSSSAASKALFG